MTEMRTGKQICTVALLWISACLAATAPFLPRPASASAESPAIPIVGAYYYPWYYPARWTNEPVAHMPELGLYRSDDPEVASRHVDWARQAGIDFFMVSWVNPGGYEDRNFRKAVLPEIEKKGYRFAFLYETPISLQIPAGQRFDFDQVRPDGRKVGDVFVAHFDYLARTYLKHPCCLRVGGAAVVEIYLVRDMVHAGPYLAAVRERLRKDGIALFLIADAVYWQPPETLDWALLKEHFQAVTAYNMFDRPDFLPSVQKQFRAADRAARTSGLALIPAVMPGYDDTALRGRDRATIDRRGGAFYAEFWNLAAEFVARDQPFLLITSFNEWHEGTELEPSREYGSAYLDFTRRHVEQLRQRTEPDTPPAQETRSSAP
jgi:hypothetical protein